MTDQLYCVLDYETFSEAPLKRCGAYEYARHPSTEILCLAYRIGTRESLPYEKTHVWAPGMPSWLFLYDALCAKTPCLLVAHNAFFEQVITRYVLGKALDRPIPYIPSRRWICTAAMAAALALPRSLEGAAKVLGLTTQKDMAGNRLVQKWCKPRKPSKHNPSTRHDDPEELERLMAYCATDVAAEVEAFLKMPMLSKDERRIWALDQKINFRGPLVDRDLVKTTLSMIKTEMTEINRRVAALTGGALYSATQRDATLTWLEAEGCFLPNLQKKTVENALAEGLAEGDAAKMLKLRQSAAKTSTAKYRAFEMRSRHDSRLRDILVYHAASTGRWSGSGVQLQNLPRPGIDDTTQAAEILRGGDLEMVRLLYGEPMSVFSSCLRSVLVAPPGHLLDVADYSAIEARVLFWVAKHEAGMQAFRDGRKLYEELATKIFSVKMEDVDGDKRFVGKQATLGSGYGMGWRRFIETCETFDRVVSEGVAKAAISAYRKVHAPVVQLWSLLELAAISAVQHPGKKYTINRTMWWCKDEFLWCQLPSGRRLAYFGPIVRHEKPPWGGEEKRPVLYHWGIDARTKKWTEAKTWGGTLTENCCSQDTLILTERGWIPIIEIRPVDRVFDGVDWVKHSGVIYQGIQEVGEWLGVRLTGNHSILAGKTWKNATDLDDYTTSDALKLGRVLVPWWLRSRVLAKVLTPFAAVIAESRMLSKRARLPAKLCSGADYADTNQVERRELNKMGTGQLSLIKKYLCSGCTVTLAWCHDVVTQTIGLTSITVGEGFRSTRRGLRIVSAFLNTQRLYRAGIPQNSIWIESTTKATTHLETFAASPGKRMHETGVTIGWWNTWGKLCRWLPSRRDSVPNGRALTPSITISDAAKPLRKSWHTTGKREKVYDLLNCGPRQRFIIMTDQGPAIAHNCVQAIARDLMACAMLRIDAAGPWRIVLSAHDELAAEVPVNAKVTNADFCNLMAELPPWAGNCPVTATGWRGPRYRKG